MAPTKMAPMSDPIFINVGAVSRSGDEVEIIGAMPGPAGLAITTLDNVTVSVDYANPGTLIKLTCPIEGAASNPGVRAFLGDDVFEQVARFLESNQDGPHALWSERSQARHRYGSLGPDFLARYAGAIIVLADRATDDERPDIERATAALDLAALERLAGPLEVLRPLLDSQRQRARGLLETCGEDLVRRALDDPALFKLLRARRYRDLLPSKLRRKLDDYQVPDVAADIAFPGTQEELRDDLWLRASDPRTIWLSNSSAYLSARHRPPKFDEFQPQQPVVREDGGGVWFVSVDFTGRPIVEQWIRVLAADHSVLAVAPLRERSNQLVTEIVVPRDVDPKDTQVLVTATPFPITKPDTLKDVKQALSTGRQAADHESNRNFPKAKTAWSECGRCWQTLGDTDRAEAAALLADTVGDPDRAHGNALFGRPLVVEWFPPAS